MNNEITQILSFLKEIDNFKDIKRQTILRTKNQENDVEHTWHLVMFLITFEKHLPKNINFLRMIKMALIHDLPEIYCGDTFAFKHKPTQKKEEMKSAKKLFKILPEEEEKEFTAIFEEYEECETKEAKIVKIFDKFQPTLQEIITNGETYKKFNLKIEQIEKYLDKNLFDEKIIKNIHKELITEIKEKNIL